MDRITVLMERLRQVGASVLLVGIAAMILIAFLPRFETSDRTQETVLPVSEGEYEFVAPAVVELPPIDETTDSRLGAGGQRESRLYADTEQMPDEEAQNYNPSLVALHRQGHMSADDLRSTRISEGVATTSKERRAALHKVLDAIPEERRLEFLLELRQILEGGRAKVVPKHEDGTVDYSRYLREMESKNDTKPVNVGRELMTVEESN